MKILSIYFAFVCAAFASDTQVCLWRESRDAVTKVRQFSFFVVSHDAIKQMLEEEARGESDQSGESSQKLPADGWAYLIALHGEATRYEKGRILVAVGHDALEISSGHISVDLSKKQIEIDLVILERGEARSFPGNGRFTFTTRSS